MTRLALILAALAGPGWAYETAEIPPGASVELAILACGGAEGNCRWITMEIHDATLIQCQAASESATLWRVRQQPLGVWVKRYGCREIGGR